ncbi:hypothetical protein P3693_25650, partial [Vibrio parahaemolyticus]|nr:hypothetical protein [Vibrio parahaemolyticus]
SDRHRLAIKYRSKISEYHCLTILKPRRSLGLFCFYFPYKTCCPAKISASPLYTEKQPCFIDKHDLANQDAP